MRIRLHRYIPQSRVEGPGLRAVLWVQGCPIRCPGCINRRMWPMKGGFEMDADDLARRILNLEGLEGVTFLGGEPFAQADALAHLARKLRAGELGVMTFTGYRLEDLRAAADPATDALLAATDLLIDGPYLADQPETVRPWIGSANQRFHYLSERYQPLASKLDHMPNGLELRISPGGELAINGMADAAELAAWLTVFDDS